MTDRDVMQKVLDLLVSPKDGGLYASIELLRRQLAAPVAPAASLPSKEALTDAIAAGLCDTYHCTRVWSAWGVGTMDEGDFAPVDESDTPAELADAVLALLAAPVAPAGEPMRKDSVNWVVNDLGELGVCVNGRYFFLYKGDNIEYGTDVDDRRDGVALHDDGTPMMVRMVGKREFGETCHPITCMKAENGVIYDRTPRPYRNELIYTPGLSDGEPGDGNWRPLPAPVVPASPPDVPPGWVLVPVEPTDAMKFAGAKAYFGGCHDQNDFNKAYRAMIAAAQKAPT